MAELISDENWFAYDIGTRKYCLDEDAVHVVIQKFDTSDNEFKLNCYAAAGQYSLERDNIANAINCYWKVEDYESILKMKLTNMLLMDINGTTFTDIAIKILKECPDNIQKQYPLSLLRLVYTLFPVLAKDREKDMEVLMNKIRDFINDYPPEEQDILMGEWWFISSLMIGNIEKSLEFIKIAQPLIKETVEVLDNTEPFMFGCVGALSYIHKTIGDADNEGELLGEYTSIYSSLTAGGAAGIDDLYDAECAYYRGDFETAELLCYKAAYRADERKQDSILLGAARTLATISIFKVDEKQFKTSLNMMEKAKNMHPQNRNFMSKMIDICKSSLHLELSATMNTADWIRTEQFQNIPRLNRQWIYMVKVHDLIISGDMVTAFGLAEMTVAEFRHDAILINGALQLFLSLICKYTGQKEGVKIHLEHAVKLYEPDGFWMLFATFYNALQQDIDEFLSDKPLHIKRLIRDLDKSFRQGQTLLNSNLKKESLPYTLTKREHEIAELAVQGMHNSEIAETLGITIHTVKMHLKKIFEKLKIDRRSKLDKYINS